MSRITIRKYETNGRGFLKAEIVWDPNDPTVEPVTVSKELPTGEIASLAVIPSAEQNGYIIVPIYPDDVPEVDVFALPINLAGPIPPQLLGARLPSIYFSTPYRIKALADTDLGFQVAAGVKPTTTAATTASVTSRKTKARKPSRKSTRKTRGKR